MIFVFSLTTNQPLGSPPIVYGSEATCKIDAATLAIPGKTRDICVAMEFAK